MGEKRFTRRVKVQEAKLLDARPAFIKNGDARTYRQVRGLDYERRVVDYVRQRCGEENVIHGAWFKYVAGNRDCWCSPDIIVLGNPLILIEVKLTTTARAIEKLCNLYQPIVEAVWPEAEVRAMQVANNVRLRFTGPYADDWDDIWCEGAWTPRTLVWRKI